MKTFLKWFLLLLLPVALHAEKRVGLVIGCGNYGAANALPNPVKDAALVAAKLRKLQFNVVESFTDVNSREFNRKLEQFKNEAQGADVALFYFAGHGIEVDDVNYLLPIDAVLEEEADLKQEAIALPEVLKLLTEAQVKAKLVILDCCRNNPFAASSKQRGWMRTRAFSASGAEQGGLADVRGELPQGTIIMLAAEPGKKAKDGPAGGDSPLAVALDECMGLPAKDGRGSLDVFHTMTAISKAVSKATDGAQNPWLKFDGHPELMEELAFASFVVPMSEPRPNVSTVNNADISHIQSGFVSVDMQRALDRLEKKRGVSATSKEDEEQRKNLSAELVEWVHTKCRDLELPVVLDKSSLGLSKTPFIIFASDMVQDFTSAVTSDGGRTGLGGSNAQKIALLDMRKVFAGYDKAKAASESLGQTLADAKAEGNQYYAIYKKLWDEAQVLDKERKNSSLNEKARAAKDDIYQKKMMEAHKAEKEMSDFQTYRQAQIDQQQHSQAQELYDEVAAAVRARAAASGYDLVFDKSCVDLGSNSFVVAEGIGFADWTDEIITDLNWHRLSSVSKSKAEVPVTVRLVDIGKAFQKWHRAQQTSDLILSHVDKAKAEIKARTDAYQKLVAEVQALDKGRSNSGLSMMERNDEAGEYKYKSARLKSSEDDLNAFRARRQKEIDEEQLQKAKELYDQMIAVIQSSFPLGAQEILLNKAAFGLQGMPLVCHIPDDVRDLTDALIGKLNGSN